MCTHIEVRGLVGSFFFFEHIFPRGLTEVIRLSNQHLYLLNHITSSSRIIIVKNHSGWLLGS